MLVVTVEIWPGGDEYTKRTISTMHIANVTDLRDVSDYKYVIKEDKGFVESPVNGSGTIKGHYRKQTVWELIRKAINGQLP